MKHCIGISLFFILLLHQSLQLDEKVVLINDPSHVHYPPYSLLPSSSRIKRDQSAGQCDPHTYTKLYSCSQLTDCTALASCLQSIHCSLNHKSFGSVIVNLLHLLGINTCHHDDQKSLCSNAKRLLILHNLLTHWTDNKVTNHIDSHGRSTAEDDNYCQTIPDFLAETTNEVREHCSSYTRQAETFLENHLCSAKLASVSSTSSTSELEDPLPWSKWDETLRKLSTTSSKIVYFNEEEDLDSIDSSKTLQNTTEQTVYTNDHRYYNVSYIIWNSEATPLYFVEDSDQFITIHALADHHRTALSIDLKFNFPFYGHTIQKIMVATGGFIFTGDFIHSAMIGSTQYVAPFMANFDVSIGRNQSNIKYFDNSTHFICTWNNLYLRDQPEIGPFTFQAILENTGNIYFNYIRIPSVHISSLNHAHRIGLSDAYVSEHTTKEHVIRVITLYDKLHLDREKIRNGVSVVFNMDNTCNTFMDCTSCLANRGIRYNCSWCETIEKCSDGNDRSHHQWTQAHCHYLASTDACPTSGEDSPIHTDRLLVASSERTEPYISSPQHSTMSMLRTIVVTLLITILILSLVAFLWGYIYAYRHPTSPPGIWLLEHRPANYIARFTRKETS